MTKHHNEDIVVMARAAMRDERLSDGALYGKLADEIERLRADAEQDDRLRVACLELRDEARAENVRLRHILARCRCILNNMAWERDGAWFNRWYINHEPLRADAKNILPEIDRSLCDSHKEGEGK